MFATIFSSLDNGYEITSSFVGRVSLFTDIETLSWPVSISTCYLYLDYLHQPTL